MQPQKCLTTASNNMARQQQYCCPCRGKLQGNRGTSHAECCFPCSCVAIGQLSHQHTFCSLVRRQSNMPTKFSARCSLDVALGMTGTPRCMLHFSSTCRTKQGPITKLSGEQPACREKQCAKPCAVAAQPDAPSQVGLAKTPVTNAMGRPRGQVLLESARAVPLHIAYTHVSKSDGCLQ